jgi:hypothetical protein
MENSLFPKIEANDYLLDIKYEGTSFNGVMEIDALGRELLGLEICLQRTIEVLKKHKKIDFSLNEVDILVEAFERGSFKKKIKLVFKKGIKGIEGHPATSNIVATFLISTIGVLATLHASEIKQPSPKTIEKLKDQVKIELIQDKEFTAGLSDFVRPIKSTEDRLIIKDPVQKELVLDYEQKTNILTASSKEEKDETEKQIFETLKGHITRVDLDADVNHIGFKVEDKGALVLCNLPVNITREQMKDFLDAWVEIHGLVTYYGPERKHVKVETIKLVTKSQQSEIVFENK